MRTLIPKTQVMNMHIIGSGEEEKKKKKKKKSSLIGCMQMSSYWGSGTAVGKTISRAGGGGGRGIPPPTVGTFSKLRVSKSHFKALKNDFLEN